MKIYHAPWIKLAENLSREHRGKGFGRAILLRGVEKLKEANMKAIMLQVAAENATALRLYKSCGFQETSTMDYFKFFSRL